MQSDGPPAKYRGVPHAYTLNAGERLWRVHPQIFGPTEFNSNVRKGPFGGGRFDGTNDDPYSFYYAGLDQTTALTEVFLRDELRFTPSGYRVLLNGLVKGYRISAVDTVVPLTMISLRTGPDLAAIGMSTWVVQGDATYAESRAVAHWLRGQAPWAHGIIWTSTVDLGKPAIMLFGDRCSPDVLREVPTHCVAFHEDTGAAWLNATLAPYHVQVRPPRRRRAP